MSQKSPEQIVDLHPASYRHLGEGHPWVIKDKYTEQFRSKTRFLIAKDKKTDKQFLLLNDTAHPKIKARLWKADFIENESIFETFLLDLKERLQVSLEKRAPLLEAHERENIFLAFGEADSLPGLFLLKLGEGLIIQSYARYWKKFQKDLLPILKDFKESIGFQWIAWQEREDTKTSLLQPLLGKMPDEMIVKEWGVQYKIKLTQGYDLGLYTDMAAIREKCQSEFRGKSFLNLYSYTGAWSLFALANGATEVKSSDLSKKYLSWLEENIELNNFTGNHQSLPGDNLKTLRDLQKSGKSFDLILCDPPSFSSDKKKTTSAMKAYEEILPLLSSITNPGGKALCFLNTHSISWNKFESKIQEISSPLGFRVSGKLKLNNDCPVMKGFPEGNYLKGVILKKVKNKELL